MDLDCLSIKKSDKNILILAPSPIWKFYDFELFLASLLLLDFHAKTMQGAQALFSAKLSFFFTYLLQNCGQGYWIKSLFFLFPLSMIIASFLTLGYTRRYRFDKVSKRIFLEKNFYFFPIERKEAPFEGVKRILLLKNKGGDSDFTIMLEEGSGRKTLLARSEGREKLRMLAKRIQEITQLPLN